ncbi:MAG: Re/Si-specific NAD(P)(+) transhydrogenase subunit alpha [Candidatus Eisenbacteria bacterium]|uniref:NAD(P) transhydrogenase subunit alpha n=1 Tax=Eiseniibacteriota bacterium TaxID=2212470 RepID=A0A956NCF7_UNCEI|nr:Re/Si-specific NAD(P)(+) transhydrogenase subunit alpha [Candidatus Eisenbacteria bacterium]MCB9462190.1 Re/Si-specific NAD(P)(+) transhydrogenase subunit alpha [Candidatus Eisenbacteria bacterium]
MKIGVPKEVHPGERRVAVTPESAGRLQNLGFQVAMEAGAGVEAHFPDDAYRAVGVEIVSDTRSLWANSDLILKVRAPETHPSLGVDEASLLREGGHLISFIWPAENKELLERLAARKATIMAMDCVPRTTRAQKLDALSSMANIGGYRAVIEAAHQFGRFFTGQVTAAGKIPPAKFLVIGAGVAGLAAIGTARGLGAIVRAFDTRPEVAEQIQSMGAEFLTVDIEEEGSGGGGYAKVMSEAFIKAEMELFAEQAKDVDIIITTALIPGRKAPVLITEEMVKLMKPGSVIVDLAAEKGGNCELTEPGQIVQKHGVILIGYMDLPSRLPSQSSQLYATNLRHLLTDLSPEKNGELQMNMEDEIVRGVTVIKEGAITWPPPAPAAPPAPKPQPAKAPVAVPAGDAKPKKKTGRMISTAIAVLAFIALGWTAPLEFLTHFMVFVLSIFVGYMVIWNVSPALHTPLMAVTNAVSGIIVLGSLLLISGPLNSWVTILAFVATLFATINVFGGFFVTQRMLQMFRK